MPETSVAGSAWVDKDVDMTRVITHAVKYFRDLLRINLIDPQSRSSDWIFNQFPRRSITYPIVTVAQPTLLKNPMGASNTLIEEGIVAVEVSIFSKYTLERDEIADEVLAMEKAQRNDLRDHGLFDARVTACYDAEFDDTKEVFRKIMVIQFGVVG